MKIDRYKHWRNFCLLLLVALSVQGCLGFGGNSNGSDFTNKTTQNGKTIGVNNQIVFKGKIYFTLGHSLYVLDGTRKFMVLAQGGQIYDPSVSPNGKLVAFDVRSTAYGKYYSNLEYVSASGGSWHKVLDGNGHFYSVPGNGQTFIHDDYFWYAQPAWSPDGKTLIFLSDLEKELWYSVKDLFQNAPFLDPQIYSIVANHPTMTNEQAYTEVKHAQETGDMTQAAIKDVAYANLGDGGDRDPSYRPGPGHENQIIYTHYAYATNRTDQNVQIFMEDPTTIVRHPEQGYQPEVTGNATDPGIPITPSSPTISNIEPAFSPDGNQIAYIRSNTTTNTMGLYVMPTPENITSDPKNPDVQKKALANYNSSSLLVSGQFVSQPVWSPDGTQIAYYAYNNGTFDIWLVNVKADPKTGKYSVKGSPVQLTQISGGVDGDSRPAWGQ